MSPSRHCCSRAAFCRNSCTSMPSPFNSRQAGSGSGGKGCLDFCACLPLLLGARTGFALQARELAAPGTVEPEDGVCARRAPTQTASSSVKAKNRRVPGRLGRFVVMRLLDSASFSHPVPAPVANPPICPRGAVVSIPVRFALNNWADQIQSEPTRSCALSQGAAGITFGSVAGAQRSFESLVGSSILCERPGLDDFRDSLRRGHFRG